MPTIFNQMYWINLNTPIVMRQHDINTDTKKISSIVNSLNRTEIQI